MRFTFVLCVSFLFLGLTRCALNCPQLPAHQAKTISDLRINDIKVIMTLGDSITAGFGMEGARGVLNEYRGQSWSIGGDDNATTVANFFKHYVPSLQGSSVGTHLAEICYGPLCPDLQYHPEKDVLNAAQSAAMIRDLPNHELNYLIAQIKANKNIDLKNDWKLLTILIGANDLCASCVGKTYLDGAEFGQHLSDTLEKVRLNLPRTFVNLVQVFNLSEVYNLSLKSNTCKTIHRDFVLECDCIFQANDKGAASRQEVDNYCVAYNHQMQILADAYKAKNYDDFAVVQPFGSLTHVANLPINFLSTLDCFHPSLLAHQYMAVGLWNNMLTPANKKKLSLDLSDVPICPTTDTLLYTN